VYANSPDGLHTSCDHCGRSMVFTLSVDRQDQLVNMNNFTAR